MGNKPSLLKRGWTLLAYVAVAGFILGGCATLPANQAARQKAQAPIVQSFEVRPSADRVVVEFVSSEPTPYTAFKLLDPLRIVLDIRGELAEALPRGKDIYVAGVTDLRLEAGKTQAMSSRAVIGANRPVDFDVKSSDRVITVTITPEKKDASPPSETAEKGPGAVESRGPDTPHDPRIFFKERPGDLTQILGLDFTMLDQGRSRLIVTTDKKARYDLNQKGPKSLVLNISQATIPPLIMRHMDSKYFEGAVELVQTSLSPAEQGVSIAISLREMVPYHVKQSEKELTIDFGASSIRPPEKRIVPLKQAQAPGSVAPKKERMALAAAQEGPAESITKLAGAPKEEFDPVMVQPIELEDPRAPKVYTGARMTMDFVNADVTNVLRLIGEVSNLNIVWGPEVRGTVSMRLKDVPWDMALDLILENNKLGKKQSANVIWIAPKGEIAQLEALEKRKIDDYNARLAAQRAQREEEKAQEPLLTEYIPVDFAKAEELKPIIMAGIGLTGEKMTLDDSKIGDKIGRVRSIWTDARTNTIILTDLSSNVQKAKDIVRQFDTPVKQVMIEARIVDATDDFTRDLGMRWDNFQIQKRNQSGSFTTPSAPPTAADPTGFAGGGRMTSPGFSSNSPSTWVPNLGLVFSNLSASGLTATILDAKLALAEEEGKSKTISAPKVIAMNGQSATIGRGDEIIIPATENVAATTIKAELSLTVTPTVSYNNYVTLKIEVTDNSAPTNTRIRTKTVTTNLMIKSGETIVIGGIYSEDDQKIDAGIPGLRRLPLLKWLFAAESLTNRKSELLIFMTPTVIPTLAAR